MVTIEIGKNDAGQRLDRFLRKYFAKAPLSMIYRMVRKDVKVNGKRYHQEDMLAEGDRITVYISEEKAESLKRHKQISQIRKQFAVAYEDADILAVIKPPGLLTHGVGGEKQNTLAGQVVAYLIQRGDYHPRTETTFTPSPVQRLDRNTSGLVLFGKHAEAVREMNRLIRERDGIRKYYVSIVCGEIREPLELRDSMTKDEEKNKVRVTNEGVEMATNVYPICTGSGFTLVKVELLTGRTHQIRVQLAACGYPILGDPKYGQKRANKRLEERFGHGGQLLHAQRLEIRSGAKSGLSITAPVPSRFEKVAKEFFPEEDLNRL